MQVGQRLKHFFIPSEHNAYRPRLLHRSWLIFFLAIILATEGFLVANLVARQSSESFLAAVVPAEVIALTNDERVQNNLGQVTENMQLEAAAQAKAQDMARKGYFAHVGPDGKTPWQWIADAGYNYQYAGENLAVRFINSSDVVNAWMASPTHRANIVKAVYSDIGVGVAQGMFQGQPATYLVQFFATPIDNAAAVSVAPAVAGTSNFMQSLIRQTTRVFAEPIQATNWVLGVSAALLLVVLVLTFFMHIEVQPMQTLIQGTVVVALALGFLILNSRLVAVDSNRSTGNNGTATAQQSTTIIDQQSAAVGYSLFP